MTLPETTAPELPEIQSPPNRIARNFLVVALTSVGGTAINLFLGIYSRHIFGPSIIGQLAWCASVIAYATLLVSPGLAIIARREVARDPKQAARYVLLLFVLHVVMAILAFALIQGFGRATGREAQIQLLLFFNAFALLLLPLDLSWLLFAHERMLPLSLWGLALSIIQAGATVALVHGPHNVLLYVLLPLPFRLAGITFSLWSCWRLGYVDWRNLKLDWADVRPLVQAAVPVGMTQAMVLLYMNLDVILLGLNRGDAEVGFYSTAYSMMIVPSFLHQALSNAFFSPLARSLDVPARARQLSEQMLRALIWIGLPLSALGWAVGRYPMLLVFGQGFSNSGVMFEWLSLNIAFIFFNIGYLVPLTAWQHQNIAFRCTLAGAMVNLGLNLVLIPRYGAHGAVVSTLAAEVAVFIASIRVRRHIYPLPWPRFVLAPFLVCTAAALLMRLSVNHGLTWWIAALGGGAVCLVSCARLEPEWTRLALDRLARFRGVAARP